MSQATLLQPARNEQAYLKAGIRGFEKCGKTFTSALIAVGLHKYIKSKKSIAFLDTETGSSYVLGKFQEAGIPLLTAKSRAFVDLIAVCREAEKQCDILIIDSITHFWVELVDAYQKKMGRTRLRVQDWGPIKQEWREFSELYVNSKLHIIMCGRAGWEYDFEEDEDGVTEIRKTGTKMKAETETGFEPSLLIEMERIKANDGKIGQTLHARAWVVGDRFDVINGRCFDNPTFESFLPHIAKLNLGGTHVGIDTSKSSKDLFTSPASRSDEFRRREIALAEIKQELALKFSARTDEDKKAAIRVMRSIFGTAAEPALEQLQATSLEIGLRKLKSLKGLTAAELMIEAEASGTETPKKVVAEKLKEEPK